MSQTPKSDAQDQAVIEFHSTDRVFDGFLKIHRLQYRFQKFDGSMSDPITREVMLRGNAVGVLPYDPVIDRVALIRQHLAGNIVAGVPNRPLQVIAGMVEEGEMPSQVARRESLEEAGIEIAEEDIYFAQRFMPSPGGSSEIVDTYVGYTDLTRAFDTGIFGLIEEQEDIRLEIVTAEEAIRLLDAGEITAGPAVVALSWFARNHARLREQGRKRLETNTN